MRQDRQEKMPRKDGFFHGKFKQFQDWSTQRLDARLNDTFLNPEKHKRDIDGDVFRIFQYATASRLRNRLITGKLVGQTLAFSFAAEHAPVPVYFVPIAGVPKLTLPIFGAVSGYPLLLSSLGTALLFNLPNAIQAFSEHRWKKGSFYGASMLLAQSNLPFIFNSFYYELANIPIERRHQIKFVDHVGKALESREKGSNIFSTSINERVIKALRRKDRMTLEKRISRNEVHAEKNLARHIEKAAKHQEILATTPALGERIRDKAKAVFTKQGRRRIGHTILNQIHTALESHEKHRLEMIRFGRRMLQGHMYEKAST